MLAVVAIIRFVMPPLADATADLRASNQQVNADIDHVITIAAIAMPDATTVDVWAKNAGSGEISGIELIGVEFGRESNPIPVAYGGAGCTAPCWWHELDGAAWARGETLTIHIALDTPAEASSLYRANVRGPRGGQSSSTIRAP